MRSRITGGPTSRKLENHHNLRRNRNLEPRAGNNKRRRNNHHPNVNSRNGSSSNNLTWKRLCHRSKRVIIDCHRWCQVGRRWFSCAPHQRSKSYTPWFMETAPCLRPLVRKACGVACGIFMTCMQIWTILIPVLPAKRAKIRSFNLSGIFQRTHFHLRMGVVSFSKVLLKAKMRHVHIILIIRSSFCFSFARQLVLLFPVAISLLLRYA